MILQSPSRPNKSYLCVNILSLCKYSRVHATQKDPVKENSYQIRLSANTREVSHRRRMPKPPSSFGQQRSFHATLAVCVMVGDPDHKKALHMLSIVSKQPCSKINTELQKLMVVITDLINWSLPEKDKVRCVHERNFSRNWSMRGS